MEWWAYYQAEPWGEQRQDARSLFQARVIGSAWSGETVDTNVAVSQHIYDIYAGAEVLPDFQEALANVYGSND